MTSIPPNGFAYGKAAHLRFLSSFAQNSNRQPDKTDPSWEIWARKGFAMEPTDPNAVRMAALVFDVNGDRIRARKLMRSISSLTKRDRITNIWLVEDYGRLGDVEQILYNYDITLRTSKPSVDVLIPVMASALQQDEFIAPFVSLLQKKPPWAPRFWMRAVQVQPSLINVARLRKEVHNNGLPVEGRFDATLVRELVEAGQISAARSLVARIGEGQGSGELVRNPNFTRKGSLAPIDWQLASEGEYSAHIDAEKNQMIASAIPDSNGRFARQLIALEPGSYLLKVVLSEPLPENVDMTVQLSCALVPNNSRPPFRFVVSGKGSRENISIPDGNCRDLFLDVNFAIPEDGDFVDLFIDSINIIPA